MITNSVEYEQQYLESTSRPEEFWGQQAATLLWRKKWDHVLEYDFYKPEVKWFIGGKLNITENCIDRHLPGRANQTAILWESNDPSEPSRKITYQQLSVEVNRAANMLR
ncbi:MAG: acetyl-coenzyme A synthetase, partial [Cytophagales bacterium]|nr:acetyl-coenzyme A synthetase [Cytophagales bacterium]